MSSLLQLFNATVTLVTSNGSTPDYDRDGSTGSTKWSGSVRGFYSEIDTRVTRGSGEDVLVERSVIVDPDLFSSVSWEVGDMVTLTVDNLGDTTARVRDVSSVGSAEIGYVMRLKFENA